MLFQQHTSIAHQGVERIQQYVTLTSLRLVGFVLGFLKAFVLTRLFGVGAFMDVYFYSANVLDLIKGYMGHAGFSVVLPQYNALASEKESENGTTQQHQWVMSILGFCFFGLSVLAVVMILQGELLTHVLVPQWDGERQHYMHVFLQWSLPISVVLQVVFLWMPILMQRKQFALLSLPPIVGNASFLAIVWVLAPYKGLYAVIWGLPVSQALQLLVGWMGLRMDCQWQLNLGMVQGFLKASLPSGLIWLLTSIYVLVDNSLLATLPPGELSVFRYGVILVDSLTMVTIGMLQMTLFPSLMEAGAMRDSVKMNRCVQKAVREVFVLGLPVLLLSFLAGAWVIQPLFQWVHVPADTVHQIVAVFHVYVLTVLTTPIISLLSACYYSVQQLKPLVGIYGVFLLLRIGLGWWGMDRGGLAGFVEMVVLHQYALAMVGLISMFVLVRRLAQTSV